MTDKEMKYADSLFKQLRVLLEKLENTYKIEFENKEAVYEDMKCMIDGKIQALHSEDLLV